VADIVWSPQAIADVESIKTFISRDSELYAQLVVARLVSAVERVGEFPDSGRVVPELGDPAIREILWRNYRIVYRIREASVEIVTVFHGAMLFPERPKDEAG
jgi:plasmid stabilization system protein ParE